jgi:hypothetical protein
MILKIQFIEPKQAERSGIQMRAALALSCITCNGRGEVRRELLPIAASPSPLTHR